MSEFTVKMIMSFDGVEKTTIFPAEKVEVYFPATDDGIMPMTKHFDYEFDKSVLFINAGPNYVGKMFSEGRFYVMNEQGHTVGSFDLGVLPGSHGLKTKASVETTKSPGPAKGPGKLREP